ncbi:hypothetical protein [Actinoplanes solisilvae]|uniref:hypothetical protein n=1 Tax=Actinoplanes solisilvae TaxID=2486853 RepID=UPI000FDB548C|nr:hypothetical protein [Actinoplanes solisilvae]
MGQTGTLYTAAGRLLLDALGEKSPARSLSHCAGSPGAVRLLRELFTVAVRRGFVGRDPRDITAYVRDLLDYQSLPAGGEFARQAEAVMRSVLGEPEVAYAVSDRRRFELICLMVGDLVRPPGVPTGELVALMRQAERRAARS